MNPSNRKTLLGRANLNIMSRIKMRFRIPIIASFINFPPGNLKRLLNSAVGRGAVYNAEVSFNCLFPQAPT